MRIVDAIRYESGDGGGNRMNVESLCGGKSGRLLLSLAVVVVRSGRVCLLSVQDLRERFIRPDRKHGPDLCTE
eukprot:3628977-Rhodomonas_salina.1